MTFANYNINETMRVKLTPAGEKILRAHESDLSHIIGREWPARKPEEDGWYSFQGWDAMHIFGPHLRLGGEAPFETTVKVKVETHAQNSQPKGQE